MANCSHTHLAAFVVVSAAMLLPAIRLAAVEPEPLHLHLNMHDMVTGPDATAAEVVNGKENPSRLGKIVVMDDPMTEDLDIDSPAVGRAQGFYVFAALNAPALLFSMNLVLVSAAAGPYNRSTVAVMGRDDFTRLQVRELPVVGDTGRFRMARGYALVRTARQHGKNAVLEIDLFVHASQSV
uniref:Dirigent protein n=1 Tax=Leersia perrieri TaxID=77586 RepID=A0A0D9XDB8_9ORYZ